MLANAWLRDLRPPNEAALNGEAAPPSYRSQQLLPASWLGGFGTSSSQPGILGQIPGGLPEFLLLNGLGGLRRTPAYLRVILIVFALTKSWRASQLAIGYDADLFRRD